MPEMFQKEGVWLKGNLHCHTTVSDGVCTPQQTCRLYRDAEYDFLAMTDHWAPSEAGEFEGMQLLQGVEYDFGKTTQGGVFHIVGIGAQAALLNGVLRDDKQPFAAAQAAVEAISAAGGLAVLAHPAWSLNRPDQIAAFRGVWATEIYNTVSGEPFSLRGDSGAVLDTLAQRYGVILPLIAADDMHFCAGDECRSFIFLKARDRSPSAIMAALRQGDFYASQGPVFRDISVREDEISLHFTPARELRILSDAAHTECVSLTDNAEEYHFRPKPGCRFLRLEIVDEQGRRAFSPYLPCGKAH